MNGQKWFHIFLQEKTFGIFTLGVIACWAMSVVKSPATIVAGAIGAIAGFVTAEASAIMREQRRLTKEENEGNVINLKKVREEKEHAEILEQIEEAERRVAAGDDYPGRVVQRPPGEGGAG